MGYEILTAEEAMEVLKCTARQLVKYRGQGMPYAKERPCKYAKELIVEWYARTYLSNGNPRGNAPFSKSKFRKRSTGK